MARVLDRVERGIEHALPHVVHRVVGEADAVGRRRHVRTDRTHGIADERDVEHAHERLAFDADQLHDRGRRALDG
ncbi:hypothetical protein D3C83_179220 [compost metagenome]